MKRTRQTTLALLVALTFTGCDFLRGYAEGHSTSLEPYETDDLPSAHLGAARFLFDDFGALSTDTLDTGAVPWKLVAAVLVLKRYPGEPATVEHLRAALTGYGFIFPTAVGNWPMAQPPEFQAPLGIVSGMVQRDLPKVRVEVANLGCASCHAGVTYDAQGRPQPVAWLGLPNTSLNLDDYFDDVRDSLSAAAGDQVRVFEAVRQLFPGVTGDELHTLQSSVWPRLVARMKADDPRNQFRQGGPGRSNGIDALKVQLHTQGFSRPAAVSIPQIGDQGLHWALLSDGIFTRRGDPRFQLRSGEEAAPPSRTAEMVAFFTMPAMGLHPDRARDAVEPISEVLNFLSRWEPPKYPGVIDEQAALRGAVIYARCAECHGEYIEQEGRLRLRGFPNRLSPVAEIGTDPARLGSVDAEFIDAVKISQIGKNIDASETRGYVAPSLAGIWATAPYLHNGSVPTLAALMTPSGRPAKFWVGGHELDFRKVGIAGETDASGVYAYPRDYLPWSRPKLFDTSKPGQSNRGHEREFDGLSPSDKADLIEFLKQL